MRDYIDREYEHGMSDTEIIILRLNTLIDLTQETNDVLGMILENQNQAYLISGIGKKTKTELCDRIGCGHDIDFHKLFNRCQVSECECKQFYRKARM